MDNLLNRSEISSGVYFSKITDSRYKFNYIAIRFFEKADEKTASDNALAVNILSKTNRSYPTIKEFQRYLAKLYGLSLTSSVSKKFDYIGCGLSAYYMDDKFALNGEALTCTAADILLECLFNPVTDGDAFPIDSVETEKQVLIDKIRAEINDKRSYAAGRASEIMYEGEPAAVKANGTEDTAKAVTPQSSYAAYKNMLQNHHCEIICVGCNSFDGLKEKFAAAFNKLSRNVDFHFDLKFSPIKDEVREVTDYMDVSQSKMVVGFKSHSDDYPAMLMLEKMYGGTPSSKLFSNVREKMSLCYYCSTRYNAKKGIMPVNCGVEKANIEKAKAEILRQLELISKGEFTDEEMTAAELAIKTIFSSVSDSASELANWYLSRIIMNRIISPEKELEQYAGISRERIIEAAKSLRLDTIYILTAKDEQEG